MRKKQKSPVTAKRKPISKKLRFDILNRDCFTCQYCGQKSPNVVLHVDHKNPVANGGTNDKNNLTTACSACNSGKSDSRLGKVDFQPKKLVSVNTRQEDVDRFGADYLSKVDMFLEMLCHDMLNKYQKNEDVIDFVGSVIELIHCIGMDNGFSQLAKSVVSDCCRQYELQLLDCEENGDEHE